MIVTKSFSIATYTSDYYLLDSQSQGLVLKMSCLLPCKSCVKEDASRCETCYSPLTQDFEVTEKPYLAKEMCYAACPSGTYEHLGKYQCINCYTSLCDTCTGPDRGECTACVSGAYLINGNCVKYQVAPYFMPFLILSVVWIISVLVLMIEYDNGKTKLIPSWLSVISIFEWVLCLVEIGVFWYFSFIPNLIITWLGGFFLNFAINIAFIVVYLKKLRHL